MVKQAVHIAVLLVSAWDLYAYCQQETMLPLIAGVIVALTFFMRLKSIGQRFKPFARLPLAAVIITSLSVGYLFRSAMPIPEDVITPYPELTAAAQSASIIAAVLLWLRPLNQNNIYLIMFMAWFTVTMSINVPFSYPMFIKFSLFCLLSVITVILHTSRRPPDRRHIFRYYRDFVGFSVLLVGLTIALFFAVSRSVMLMDEAFMNAMRDYILPRHYTHFLNINPKLTLTSPGRSAFDRRPILEVDVPGVKAVYLKTQVFQDFDNGIWEEPEDLAYVSVPEKLDENDTEITLTMFTPLKDIVPSIFGITGAQGPEEYIRDENQVIYGDESRRTRVVTFSARQDVVPVRPLSRTEFELYKQVPPALAPRLKRIADAIVGTETDTYKKAELVRDFFNNGFLYSLNVNFRADNEGLMTMIEQRRPAYCTYFATAMTLLLRTQDIPVRVVTGFYTDEIIDERHNRFLGRVRNAHSWVEVLVPAEDPATGQQFMAWTSFDPTPGGAVSSDSTKKVFDFDRMVENTWLGFLRFIAHLQNIDKDKMKIYTVLALIFTMLIINAKSIFAGLKGLFRKKRRKVRAVRAPAKLQAVYRKYEHYLHKNFNETRRPAETDSDVVVRLKERNDVPAGSVEKIETFLKHYHAARFGEKEDTKLERLLG